MADLEALVHDLAGRLNALERENQALRSRVATLEHPHHGEHTSATPALPTPAASTSDTPAPAASLNRRQVLRRGLQFAAATAAAGVVLTQDDEPAQADANHTTTRFDATTSDYAVGAYHDWPFGNAIFGSTVDSTDAAIYGENAVGTGPGVEGYSESGAGVEGNSSSFAGVYGYVYGGGYGVYGEGSESGYAGVYGDNPDYYGVHGDGLVGVYGESSEYGWTAVYGEHKGTYGYGVGGIGTGSGAGVLGRNGAGEGVRGEGNTGVYAKSTVSGGYGAVIEGGKAQLRLVPKGSTGKPATGAHKVGELFLDKVGGLFICTVAGTPGTWRKVSTTLA